MPIVIDFAQAVIKPTPDGIYRGQLAKWEYKDKKGKPGEKQFILNFKYEDTENDQKRQLTMYFAATGTGLGYLAQTCVALGADEDDFEPGKGTDMEAILDTLVLANCNLVIIQNEYKDEKGNEKIGNRIDKVEAI